MTIEQFFKQIEDYYGTYENPQVKKVVAGYLTKDHDSKKYKEIVKAIMYFHKASFKAPCIASIEECIKKARIEKGQTDTHKLKTTDISRFNYLEEKKKLTDEEISEGKKLLSDLMKNMGNKRTSNE